MNSRIQLYLQISIRIKCFLGTNTSIDSKTSSNSVDIFFSDLPKFSTSSILNLYEKVISK